MKRFWRMYQVEQKLFFRSPDVILFCLLMPLGIFVLITMIAGEKAADASGLTYLQSAMAVPVLTLAVIATVCGTVAVRTFRWE